MNSPSVALFASIASVVAAGAIGTSVLGSDATPTSQDAPASATAEPVEVQPAAQTPARAAERTIPIECGGYDADGEVVNPAATDIDEASVTADGVIEIPAVCGGYTADGILIGDD